MLISLIRQESDLDKFNNLKGIELFYKINRFHPCWRKFQLDFLIFLEKVLVNFKNFCDSLKNNEKTLETIIIILSTKNFEIIVKENIQENQNSNEPIENEANDNFEENDEEINENREKEIKSLGLKILELIIDIKNVESFHKVLQEKSLSLKDNQKHDPEFEYLLAFFSHLCCISKYIDVILLNRIPQNIIEVSQELLKKKDFVGKSNYLFLIIDFFLNLYFTDFSTKNEEINDIYKKLHIEKYILDFLYEIIQKNEEPFQIIYSLKALAKIISKAIISHQKKTERSKKIYFEDLEENEQKKIMDNVIDAVMNTMKKYSDHEPLQIAGKDSK